MTFFDHNEGDGGGDCVTTLSLGEPGDAVWAACTTYSGVAPGPGFGTGAAVDGNAAAWAIRRTPRARPRRCG